MNVSSIGPADRQVDTQIQSVHSVTGSMTRNLYIQYMRLIRPEFVVVVLFCRSIFKVSCIVIIITNQSDFVASRLGSK